MLRMRELQTVALLATAGLFGCAQSPAPQAVPEPPARTAAAVDAERIGNADREPGNWMSYNRTYDEQRYSPLAGIDTGNVKRLGLAWYVDLDTAARAQESTPLVIDGVMYVTTAWSKVLALDAASGRQLWAYDPKVPGGVAVNACCDVVNRGVAAWNGKLYLGTLDGRLVALDAATGKPVWEVMTVERGSRYTITGAPRVIKGKVIIGNGGAELGVRGYVTAYDAATGQPGLALLHGAGRSVAALRTARARAGREDLDRRVVEARRRRHRVGLDGLRPRARPAVHRRRQRLAVESQAAQPRRRRQPVPVVDRRAASRTPAQYVWHYQTTPGESWDFTATQHMILADLHDRRS